MWETALKKRKKTSPERCHYLSSEIFTTVTVSYVILCCQTQKIHATRRSVELGIEQVLVNEATTVSTATAQAAAVTATSAASYSSLGQTTTSPKTTTADDPDIHKENGSVKLPTTLESNGDEGDTNSDVAYAEHDEALAAEQRRLEEQDMLEHEAEMAKLKRCAAVADFDHRRRYFANCVTPYGGRERTVVWWQCNGYSGNFSVWNAEPYVLQQRNYVTS